MSLGLCNCSNLHETGGLFYLGLLLSPAVYAGVQESVGLVQVSMCIGVCWVSDCVLGGLHGSGCRRTWAVIEGFAGSVSGYLFE